MASYTITETEAVSLTTEYRNNHEGKRRAFKIDKSEINQIFSDHPTAVGIRSYLGQENNSGPLRLIMVATDSNGNDILDVFYDHVKPCPSDCDTNSILNNGI
tara:strand:+ start:613 stop:918 length:306 start_codon:yes stop_codon:yes gene_type:complete